jgi:hypothetical protein
MGRFSIRLSTSPKDQYLHVTVSARNYLSRSQTLSGDDDLHDLRFPLIRRHPPLAPEERDRLEEKWRFPEVPQ